MKPRQQQQDAFELFQSHFDQLLNQRHPLMQLAKQIDWDHFDATFAECYSPDFGAPGKAIRLMIDLHYLKHAFDESDESVVARWVENPYWQHFCGETHMQHQCPIDPSSMTRWRQRVGADRLNEMIKQTIKIALDNKYLPPRELKHINIDTTVQEKNITYPTDSKLYYKSIIKLVQYAKDRNINLRQSYVRVGKKASIKASRYAHAKQFRRMHRVLRKLRTYVGRLIRDIKRKTPIIDDDLANLLKRCQRVRDQRPKDKKKIYSLHEPEVCCISKGKSHKRYEFGQKVQLQQRIVATGSYVGC